MRAAQGVARLRSRQSSRQNQNQAPDLAFESTRMLLELHEQVQDGLLAQFRELFAAASLGSGGAAGTKKLQEQFAVCDERMHARPHERRKAAPVSAAKHHQRGVLFDGNPEGNQTAS
jgi:hypothetical protein